MHSFAIAESGASADAWACLEAGLAVDAAIAALNAAGAVLTGLTADTGWEADGVRALHDKLVSFHAVAQAEIGRLSSRAWELDRALS
jgi:hypothetical protein